MASMWSSWDDMKEVLMLFVGRYNASQQHSSTHRLTLHLAQASLHRRQLHVVVVAITCCSDLCGVSVAVLSCIALSLHCTVPHSM
jgi:hypothetical protein